MKLKLLLPAFGLILLTGCASQNTGLYDWGGYDDGLYEFYSNPEYKDEFTTNLVKHIEALDARGTKPAPGLYAEAGTLMLKEGDKEQAVSYYEKEANAWPESQPLMSALISNLKEDDSEISEEL